MELSLNEVVLLAAMGRTPKTRPELVKEAAQLYASTKYDEAVALKEIEDLKARRFIKIEGNKLVLTYEGYGALLHAIPVVESIRAALGGVSVPLPAVRR